MATYAGQNYGAGKAGRVREGLRKCALACEAITLGIMVIMTAFGGVMSSWFIDGYHPEVIQQAHLYLFISALFYPALTMLFLYRNTLLGTGKRSYPDAGGSLRAAVENDRRACSRTFFPASPGFAGSIPSLGSLPQGFYSSLTVRRCGTYGQWIRQWMLRIRIRL